LTPAGLLDIVKSPFDEMREGFTVKCPQCAHKNPAETLFCQECGLPLSRRPNRESGTKTMNFPLRELSLGSIFARLYQFI
jgi:hypothetical protein